MKHLKIIMILLCSVLMSMTSYGQTKVAFVNSIELLNSLPEWKAAEKELETYADKLKTKLKSQEDALAKKYQSLAKMKDEGNLTPKKEQEEGAAFQKKQAELQKSSVESQQELVKKEQELTQPIRESVIKAIEKVAKNNGYDYVIDISVGAALHASESENITKKVLSELK